MKRFLGKLVGSSRHPIPRPRPVRPRLALEFLESRLSPSCSAAFGGGTWSINCNAQDDVLTLDGPGSNYLVTSNFAPFSFTRAKAGVTAVVINLASGNDTIQITPNSRNLANLEPLTTTVNVLGGLDSDAITIHDENNATPSVYTLTSTGFSRFLGSVSFSSFNNGAVIHGGHQNNDYIVMDSPAAGPTTLHTGNGANLVSVRATTGQLGIFTNLGNDTVHLGHAAGLVTLTGAVTVNGGGGGNDTLYLNDGPALASQTYTMTSATVARTGGVGLITHGGFDALTLNAGGAGDTINVQSTSAATPMTINAQTGNDTINVGNASNSLDLILGPLTIHGQGGSDTLNFRDQGTAAAKTYEVHAAHVSRTGAANVNYTMIEDLALNAGLGNDTIRAFDVPAITDAIIHAGGGNDDLFVGPLMAAFERPLFVHGDAGTNRLFITDNLPGGSSYWHQANAVFGGSAPTTINYFQMQSLEFTLGGGDDVVTVYNTAASTPVTINASGGNDVIRFGDPANSLTNFLAAVTVHGQAGTDSLTFNDHGTVPSQTYSLLAPSLSRSGIAALSWTTAEAIVLNASRGHDTINVLGTEAGTTTTVNAGLGNDTLTVGDASHSLTWIAGALTLNGDSGTDPLHLNDQATSSGKEYTLTATSVARTGAAPIGYGTVEDLRVTGSNHDNAFNAVSPPAGVPVTFLAGPGIDTLQGPDGPNAWQVTGLNAGTLNTVLTFTGIEHLIGGIDTDTWSVGNGQGISGYFWGRGGQDTLDYSTWTGDVTVNMTVYSATGAGLGIFEIEHAIGGSGNDILVGDQWSNALTGGSGRDLLIGGGIDWYTFTYSFLPDVLNGGAGEDLLIAGFTYYDFDPTWIRDVWAFPATYADRISWLQPWLNAGTVFYNYAVGGNTLMGGADLDWFFGQPTLDLHDLDALAEVFEQIF